MLKCGLVVIIEEFLMVVEYIFSYGNFNVVLCEWGICSFDSYICNVLDLSVVVVLK